MSKKVLVVKGTPFEAGISRSMEVVDAFVSAYIEANPNDEIMIRDVFETDMPYIDGALLSAWNKFGEGLTPTEEEMKKVSAYNELTEEFLAADKIIIQSPMWNLSIPVQLKGWLDTITVAGKTFKYTESGPVGLATGKKAIHIHGAGGKYSQTTGIEHSDAFVRGILGFIGVELEPTIWVEGVDYDPSAKDELISSLKEKAREIARNF